MRDENSMKVCAKTPCARSRCSTFGSICAWSSACWPFAPTPCWAASASKPFFQASKSPPQSAANAMFAETSTSDAAIAAVRSRMIASPARKRGESRKSGRRIRRPGLDGNAGCPWQKTGRTLNRLFRVRVQPLFPGGLAAVEGVDVGIAAHARHHARAGVLPEGEGMAPIFVVRVPGDRAQPVGVVAEGGKVVVLEEIDRGVDDRRLAVVALDHGE